jgi:hypothetical protein
MINNYSKIIFNSIYGSYIKRDISDHYVDLVQSLNSLIEDNEYIKYDSQQIKTEFYFEGIEYTIYKAGYIYIDKEGKLLQKNDLLKLYKTIERTIKIKRILNK